MTHPVCYFFKSSSMSTCIFIVFFKCVTVTWCPSWISLFGKKHFLKNSHISTCLNNSNIVSILSTCWKSWIKYFTLATLYSSWNGFVMVHLNIACSRFYHNPKFKLSITKLDVCIHQCTVVNVDKGRLW